MLSSAKKLQAVHIGLANVDNGEVYSSASPEDILEIAKKCNSTVTQIGSWTSTWKVSLMSNIMFGQSEKNQIVRKATQAVTELHIVSGVQPTTYWH